ncbi:MAG TPA: IS66 family insertion sequence element accessory protein TnpB [Terriglobia bacterium]|nr:IS66 family insertion sequence element accessory protein TnpB [Terriglobia bacterium]
MIQIAPQIRILVAVEAIDGRKGIDAIAQLCREKLNADPFSGYLFIFRTRRGTAIRVLQYDGQGFWLATKRLSKGRFGGGPQARSLCERCAHIRRNCCSRPAILTRMLHRHGVPCIPKRHC